jgi:manganese/zinc/iron transport system permease protein
MPNNGAITFDAQPVLDGDDGGSARRRRRWWVLPGLLLGAQLALFAIGGAAGVDPEAEFVALTQALGLPFNDTVVALGAALLGLAGGVIGSFAVLRRRALVADAVAHAALPGICIAFLLIGQRDFIGFAIGAVGSGLAGVAIIAWLPRHTRIKVDAAIGIVLSVFFGIGIAISGAIQRSPDGGHAGIDAYLLGKTAAMIPGDVFAIAVVTLNVVLVVIVLYKEFRLIGFDAPFARSAGFPAGVIDFVMMATIVVTTVIGLAAVGVVLIAALLIIPGVSARFWTERLGRMLLLAALFGVVTGLGGALAAAALPDIPAGPAIVMVGAVIFALSALLAPRRGIVARFVDRLRRRATLFRRALLEAVRDAGGSREPIPATALESRFAVRSLGFRLGVWWARLRTELVRPAPNALQLTATGRAAALEYARARRLWHRLLSRTVDATRETRAVIDDVDRDVIDAVAALHPQARARLEQALRAAGDWPDDGPEAP